LDQLKIQTGIQADTALVAVPDERLGHVIQLVGDKSLTSQLALSLIEKYNAQVLGFERIRNWHSLERLPRTDLGKLIAAECLDRMRMQVSNGSR
jgi:acyl-coenzyme A synthetase/AMP-(fatty) acid ligase